MIKKCIVCGNDYYVTEKKGAHKRSKFCSRKCLATTHRKARLEWAKQDNISHPEKRRAIQKRWRGKHLERIKNYGREYQLTARGIFTSLGKRGKHSVEISKEDFIQWYDSQEKKCFYCDIPETEIPNFPKFFNGTVNRRLSIDRVDNNKGYELGNIVLACRRCNGIKSDFFSVYEMRQLAQKWIIPKWKGELWR